VQETNVKMFEDWPFKSKGSAVSTAFFRLTDEPKGTGSYLEFKYSLEWLKDRVEVSEVPKFNEAIDEAKDSLGYTLTYQTPEQRQKTQRRTLNWAVVAAALCFFGTASFIAYRYFRESKLRQSLPPPVDAPAGLNGIGGWLILLAIGQILRPIGFIKAGFDLWPTMFYTDSWRSLTDPIESSYHSWWAPALLFELSFNIACLVFSALLIALFVRKRAVWPRAFVFFLIVTFVGNLLDTYFDHHISPANKSLISSVPYIVGTIIGAAIWIPYLYRSKRVKATFRY
jgi:hypothetical protein